MKTEIIIGLIGILLIALVGGFVWQSYNDQGGNINANNINATVQTTQEKVAQAVASGATTLDATVLAQHNSSKDCWLLIDGNVYDVSTYLTLHPGGSAIIIPYCGKDATVAFATKAGQGSHSSFAYSQLTPYLIGTFGMQLADTTPGQNTNTTEATTNTSVNTAAPVATSSITLNTTTVSRHDTSSDCWIIINNTIYSVSSYLKAHPGGSAIIIPYCGKDATVAFATEAGQGSHSSYAYSQLANYAIGTLNSNTTVENIQNTTQTIQNTPVPPSEDDD